MLFVPSTGDAKMMVAYFCRSAVVVNGVDGRVTDAWAGSHTSTVKPFC